MFTMFYHALQLSSLYSSMSQTYRFPAHLQTTNNIIYIKCHIDVKDYVWTF